MTDDHGPTADPFHEANEGWGAGALTGSHWILVELDDGPIALDRMPTLDIGSEGEVSGLAGCNRFRGRALIGDGTVSMGPVALTRMLCPPPLMALERAYLAALESVSGWRRSEDRLELSGEDGVVRLVFRPGMSGRPGPGGTTA